MKREKSNEIKRKKTERNVKNIIGCCLILLLFAIAFFLPELYFFYSDKKKEDEVAYIDAEMAAYQLQYSSMMEKLQTLGECETAGWEMQTTLLQETTDDEKRSHLTERVNEELPDFGMEYFCYITQCNVKNMTSCKLYTLYPKEELDKGFQGISFWQLIYEQQDCIIKVILDTEFEKIYAVSIAGIDELVEAEEREAYESNAFTSEENFGILEIKNVESYGVESYSFEDTEWSYAWLDTLLFYYDLDDSEDLNWSTDWEIESENRMQKVVDYFEGYSNYTIIGVMNFSFMGAEYKEIGMSACVGTDAAGQTELVMGLITMFEYLQL